MRDTRGLPIRPIRILIFIRVLELLLWLDMLYSYSNNSRVITLFEFIQSRSIVSLNLLCISNGYRDPIFRVSRQL